MESCSGSSLFKRDAQDQAYIDELKWKSDGTWRRVLFWAWGFFTDYGRSLWRVAALALFFIAIFGTIYKFVPSTPPLVDYGRHAVTPFSPYYFSFVTYTTLGFGDVSAGSMAGEICVSIEVVLGYVTLGLLLSILANTVARRS